MAEPRIVIPVVAGSSPVGHPPLEAFPRMDLTGAAGYHHSLMPPDEHFMAMARSLARRGVGRTWPNPAVGCVIVKGGRVIARGWHRRAGCPHAEVEALRALKRPDAACGATAYVTLEPCSTQGRTPPCTRALIDAGIARVVVGATDPNPKHRGRAFRLLRRAGLEVTVGVQAKECAALNPEFHHAMATGLPWVIAKCGMSLDGRLTRPPGEGQWITSPAARADAMKLRAGVDAILVGAGTVRADDPQLTVRGLRGARQPWRVVWAPRGDIQATARLLHDEVKAQTIILRQSSLRAALRSLARRGIGRVLVEGGGHTLGCAVDGALINEVVFYIAPLLAGGDVPATGGLGIAKAADALRIPHPDFKTIGGCIRVSGHVGGPGSPVF